MTAAQQQKTGLMEGEKSFLRALLYFDIFNYPLTEEEIVRFSTSSIPFSSGKILEQLISHGLVFKLGQFYSVQSDITLSNRRILGNKLAKERMQSAKTYSKLVASFPFVKAVMLSGSLSKGFMDEKSDIDYFIITDPDRLWVVRSALAIFRRLFLFNSHKNLCTNYFIDTENLAIPDRNYFTAIEFCTLVPMYGEKTIQDFRSANGWVESFLPACHLRSIESDDKAYQIKNILRKSLPQNLLSKLNLRLMEATIKYWKRKYAGPLNDADFEVAFRSRPGVSKSHPQFFQKKVLNRLSEKMKLFQEQHGVDLSL